MVNGVVKDQIDFSRYEKNDIIKIQAFVRGSLCRARVLEMVQQKIDEILLRLGRSTKPKDNKGGMLNSENGFRGSISVSNAQAKTVIDAGDNTQRVNDARQPMNDVKERDENMDGTEHSENSTSSIGVMELVPNEVKDSFTTNDEIKHGSVSSIMSKFESKNDPNASVPLRRWSAKKKQDGKQQEEKQQDEKQQDEKQQDDDQQMNQEQSQTIGKSELQQEEMEDSTLPTENQKTSYVKNLTLRSNATKHVSSSEKVLEEQGMRMNGEIQQLLKDINRVGEPGEPSVMFGELFDDEIVANYYEALVGTLKAAKKKKLIKYNGQYLLKGINDKVIISIV